MKKLLAWFLDTPVEQLGEYFTERQRLRHELKKAKLEGEIKVEHAKAEAKAAKAQHISSWEMASLSNAGWKDEFVLILISVPLPLSFVPGLQEHVLRGFQVLGTTPAWYMGVVLAVFLAVYGIRWKGAEGIALRKGQGHE